MGRWEGGQGFNARELPVEPAREGGRVWGDRGSFGCDWGYHYGGQGGVKGGGGRRGGQWYGGGGWGCRGEEVAKYG